MESDLFYVGLKVQILRFFGPFRKTVGMLCRNHQRKNGKRPLAPFWSKSQLVLCLYNISHFSAGDSTLLRSGKRTNGRPPEGGEGWGRGPQSGGGRGTLKGWRGPFPGGSGVHASAAGITDGAKTRHSSSDTNNGKCVANHRNLPLKSL